MAEIYLIPIFAHKIGPWKHDRIPVVEFARIARDAHGWDLGSLEILDLINGLGQGFADGTIQASGRLNPNRYSSMSEIYLPIPRSHWRFHHLDAFSAINVEKNLNVESREYRAREVTRYMDLHVNRIQAHAWLQRYGKSWKGRTSEMPRASLEDILK